MRSYQRIERRKSSSRELLTWLEKEMQAHELSAKERGVALVVYDRNFAAVQMLAAQFRSNPFEQLRAAL